MKILLVINFVILGLFAACDKSGSGSKGEIISFSFLKCGCCWGWTLEVEGKTIKVDDSVIGELVGYEINKPIKVTVELGAQKEFCSEYYEVKSISLR